MLGLSGTAIGPLISTQREQLVVVNHATDVQHIQVKTPHTHADGIGNIQNLKQSSTMNDAPANAATAVPGRSMNG